MQASLSSTLNRLVYLGITLSIACLVFGCQSPGATSSSSAAQQDLEAVRAARQAKAKAEEERRVALEEQRRSAESARRASQLQREEAQILRERYERYTTAELKIMRARYLGLSTTGSGRDLRLSTEGLIPRKTSDEKSIAKVIEIERELLRRWKAGDAEAELPDFKVPEGN